MFGFFKQQPRLSLSAQSGIRDVVASVLAAAANKETNADIARLQLASEKWLESLLPVMPPCLKRHVEASLAKVEELMK